MTCVKEINYDSTEQADVGRTLLQYNSEDLPACSILIGMYPLGGCPDGGKALLNGSINVSISLSGALSLPASSYDDFIIGQYTLGGPYA